MLYLFSEFRAANAARLPLFRSKSGTLVYAATEGGPAGFDWDRTTWCMALQGEVGELANEIKKVRRGDATLEARRVAIGEEITDVLTYLDLVAWRFGTTIERALFFHFGFPHAREGGLEVRHLPVGSVDTVERTMGRIGEALGVLCRCALDAEMPQTLIRLFPVTEAIATIANLLFHLFVHVGLDPVPTIAAKWNAVSVRIGVPLRLWSDAGPG